MGIELNNLEFYRAALADDDEEMVRLLMSVGYERHEGLRPRTHVRGDPARFCFKKD